MKVQVINGNEELLRKAGFELVIGHPYLSDVPNLLIAAKKGGEVFVVGDWVELEDQASLRSEIEVDFSRALQIHSRLCGIRTDVHVLLGRHVELLEEANALHEELNDIRERQADRFKRISQ